MYFVGPFIIAAILLFIGISWMIRKLFPELTGTKYKIILVVAGILIIFIVIKLFFIIAGMIFGRIAMNN